MLFPGIRNISLKISNGKNTSAHLFYILQACWVIIIKLTRNLFLNSVKVFDISFYIVVAFLSSNKELFLSPG